MRTRYGKDPDGQMNLFGGSNHPAKLRRRKGERRPPDETAYVKRLLDWAKLPRIRKRLTLERVNSGTAWRDGRPIKLAPKGTPDLKGQMRGKLKGQKFVVEAKVNGRPCEAEQIEKLRDAVERGDWAFVARDSVEAFEEQIAEAEAGRYSPPAEIFP